MLTKIREHVHFLAYQPSETSKIYFFLVFTDLVTVEHTGSTQAAQGSTVIMASPTLDVVYHSVV